MYRCGFRSVDALLISMRGDVCNYWVMRGEDGQRIPMVCVVVTEEIESNMRHIDESYKKK